MVSEETKRHTEIAQLPDLQEIPDRKYFSSGSTRDGGVDDRLRRRRRRPIRAPSSTSFIHHDNGFTEKRIGDAGECVAVFREGSKHDGHRRELERERSSGRQRNVGNDQTRWRLHRTRGAAGVRDGANYG